MNSPKNLPCQQLAGVTALALISFTTGFKPVQAQSAKPALTVRYVPPPTLPDRWITSGRQRGGATRRGQCPNVSLPLTALVPATQETIAGKQKQEFDPALSKWQSVLGLTSNESPTLWFYVPYRLTLPVNFVLQDKQGKTIYKTSFTSQTQPGIVSFRLPKEAHLESNKLYQWYFAISCNAQVPTFVKGWVQRVALSPALKSQLKAATPRERIVLYAANGIWHEALTTLALLHRTNPQDATLAANWESLLQSADLQDIAKEPLQNREILRSKPISQ